MKIRSSKKNILIALIILFPPVSFASPMGAPPPEFFADVINTATRFNTYCLFEDHICIEREVKEWGQTCHSGKDTDYVIGTVPLGFHYSSWRCETDNPNDEPPGGKSGK